MKTDFAPHEPLISKETALENFYKLHFPKHEETFARQILYTFHTLQYQKIHLSQVERGIMPMMSK